MGNNYNDKMTNCHAYCADNEGRLATPAVDVHDRRNGGNKHDDANHTGCEKRNGVVGKPEFAEDDGGIVQNCVDSGPSVQGQ